MKKSDLPPGIITPIELVRLSGLSKSTVWRLIGAGIIPTVKLRGGDPHRPRPGELKRRMTRIRLVDLKDRAHRDEVGKRHNKFTERYFEVFKGIEEEDVLRLRKEQWGK